MGLAVLNIAVGTMVSFMLVVVLIYSGDLFLIYLYFDSRDCERCIPYNDSWIKRGESCTVRFLWLVSGVIFCNLLTLE